MALIFAFALEVQLQSEMQQKEGNEYLDWKSTVVVFKVCVG